MGIVRRNIIKVMLPMYHIASNSHLGIYLFQETLQWCGVILLQKAKCLLEIDQYMWDGDISHGDGVRKTSHVVHV